MKESERPSYITVRDQKKTARKARQERAEKIAAYDEKYKAAALERREKLAAEAAAKQS